MILKYQNIMIYDGIAISKERMSKTALLTKAITKARTIFIHDYDGHVNKKRFRKK